MTCLYFNTHSQTYIDSDTPKEKKLKKIKSEKKYNHKQVQNENSIPFIKQPKAGKAGMAGKARTSTLLQLTYYQTVEPTNSFTSLKEKEQEKLRYMNSGVKDLAQIE